MKVLLLLTIGALLAGFCTAQQQPEPEWQRKAEQSHGTECVKACLHAAHITLEDANKLFTGGNNDAAHSRITTSVGYVRRAVDCSVQSHKAQKQAEIELRELIRRTRDIMKTLEFADQQQVGEAVTELERQRDRLLHSLFGAAAGATAEKKR
jgi:hypothetical protein